MAYKRISNKRPALFFRLFWLLFFIPLISAAGSQNEAIRRSSPTLPELIYDSSEHFSSIESANLDGLLNRIGDSRLVLLGEASHGTAEFYDMRARITRELIEKKGFTIVAVEADWPDATSIDYFIRGSGKRPKFHVKPFTGYPSWMWANHSVLALTQWLKDHNQGLNSADDARSSNNAMRFDRRVGFYGLDLYNMYNSIEAVLNYLQDVDPKAAEVASRSYACLWPWANDPSVYSRVMQSGRHRGCGYEVFTVLQDLHKKRALYSQVDTQTTTEAATETTSQADRKIDKQRYFNAVQNARLVRNGERYYRTMYDSSSDSWNQRDNNMFKTLLAILNYRGQTSKAVIWAHNSHIGDARATDMRERGEFNLGQLVRQAFADDAYLIGFGTDHGTVAAASEWGGPMKVMPVRPAQKNSYEHLFHEVKADNFILPLANTTRAKPIQNAARKKLMAKRLQRAIGTTYDPENELKKHYSHASLPRQFDEYIWFDETRAVKPLIREP